MILRLKSWFFVFFTLLSLPAFSGYSVFEGVQISQGHIRETIPGTSISSAYLTIRNTHQQALKLIAVTSKVSPRLELHEHSMTESGMMKMRQVPYILIPANSEVTLEPSGLHIMIFELTKGLMAGEQVSLNLIFENQKIVNITLPVQSIKQRHHHHH
jgi:copper(I)-binding protein